MFRMAGFFTAAILAMLLTTTVVRAAEPPDTTPPDMPFHFPFETADDAILDMRPWLDPPAGKHGPIIAGDGHFAFKETGKRVRFWATNLSGDACFPEKEIAGKVADRLAKFGFNLVRFHHMDSSPSGRIFDDSYDDTRHLDPENLDRLDYLIAELKKRGLYININLHVGRRFREGDGVAQPQWLSYGKFCVIFDPRMIELQKEFARQLLGHKNPYTGLTYADDPAVVIVEITNENSLFLGWMRGFLRGEQRSRPAGGGWTDIPPFYGEELTQFYNAWLGKKYGSREALEKAWAEGARSAGKQMLTNGDFSQSTKGWNLSRHNNAAADWTTEDGVARIEVKRVTDTRWHVMLTQSPVAIEKGEKYAVRFRIKASSPRTVAVETAHAGPYRGYMHHAFEAPEEWTEKQVTFVAEDDDDNVRLSFQLGAETGAVWLDDVWMGKASIIGIHENEDPKQGTVQRLQPEDLGNVTTGRFRDESRFYYDTELDYYRQMEKVLKDELGVKALVEGTNHNYGLPCLRAEAQLDLMDCHAYWQHPRFPNRPWDRSDWLIPNTAMLDSPPQNTITGLARSAVSGMPFTVSEYNHPFPSEYASESPLLLAAYGALQDWDALYFYTFCHSWSEENLSGNQITGYFDVCNEVQKMAQMPAAALLFRRGDVRRADRLVEVDYSLDRVWDSVRMSGRSGYHLDGEMPWSLPLVHRFRIGSFTADKTTNAEDIAFKEPTDRIESDTGEIVWTAAGERQNRLSIDSPRTQAAIGWIGGREVKTADATFRIDTPFGAVSLCSLDGKPIGLSDRILITAAARCANTGMEWNEERTTLGTRWGGAPLLIEPVEGEILLSRNPGDAADLFTLDGRGVYAGRAAKLAPTDRGIVIPLNKQEPATVWYELKIRR